MRSGVYATKFNRSVGYSSPIDMNMKSRRQGNWNEREKNALKVLASRVDSLAQLVREMAKGLDQEDPAIKDAIEDIQGDIKDSYRPLDLT